MKLDASEPSEVSGEDDSTAKTAYVARQIERLNHLFRHAGDSKETRLIYQAVLNFQLTHKPS